MGSLFVVAACAKPPTQELADAQDSVNVAIQAGAEDYAADELRAAQDALADANAKVEGKDYNGAKISAMDAKSKAQAAAGAVEGNKTAAKGQAEERAKALKDESEALNARIAKVKGKAAADLKAQSEALSGEAAAVQSDLQAERFKPALEKADAAQVKLDELKAKVEEAEKAAPASKGKKK